MLISGGVRVMEGHCLGPSPSVIQDRGSNPRAHSFWMVHLDRKWQNMIRMHIVLSHHISLWIAKVSPLTELYHILSQCKHKLQCYHNRISFWYSPIHSAAQLQSFRKNMFGVLQFCEHFCICILQNWLNICKSVVFLWGLYQIGTSGDWNSYLFFFAR